MWNRLPSARTYGWILAVADGATFPYGLAAAGNDDISILPINRADNVLHLLSAIAGVAIALWPARRDVRAA